MKLIYKSLFCAVVASMSVASYANSVNQGDSPQASALVGLNFWNEAGENVFIMANHEGNGYRKSYTMSWTQHTAGWELPVGSNLCVFEQKSALAIDAGDVINYFKVVGKPSYTNTLKISGGVAHTHFSGDVPNLQANGWRHTTTQEPLDIASLLRDCQNHH